jgi:hypothetical protein
MQTVSLGGLRLVGICCAVCWGSFYSLCGNSFANPIPDGFSYFNTPAGGAIFNPSRYGLGPDIDIPMQGRSIHGNVDTVIWRKNGLPFPPIDPLGTMQSEIIALSLESINPVPIGTSFFDVFVDLNPEKTSPGSITVTSHNPNANGGGTFDSFFTVNARATLTEVGNPFNKMVFTIQDTISSTGSTWTHLAPPGYPGPSGFVPGPITHTGPHPQTNPGTGPPLPTRPLRRGYDFFVTPPGSGTFVDLGPMGIVQLEGVPMTVIGPGMVDTVVLRKSMGPLEGGTDIIDIELVALHLRSSNPVDMTPVGGPPAADLHITVDPNNPNFDHPDFNLPAPIPVPPSIGQMEIFNQLGPAGGQFRACFGDEPGCDAMPNGLGLGVPGGGVHSNAIFVVPGGDPSNPADVIQIMQAPTIFLSSLGQFNHGGTVRGGDFDMTAVSHTGPHPAQPERISEFIEEPDELEGDFNLDGTVDAGDYVHWRKHNSGDLVAYATWRQHFGESLLSGSGGDVDGAVPEPGSIAVVAVGMLGAWLRRRS